MDGVAEKKVQTNLSTDVDPKRTRDIIWTRSLSDWEVDRTWFGADASRVLHLPCIRLLPLSLDESTVAGSASASAARSYSVCTSANAARFALKTPAIVATMRQSSVIYTHGAVTAGILRSAGLPAHLVEAKSSKELGAFLLKELPEGADLFWPCGEAVAHDFTPELKKRNVTVRRVVLYETRLELTAADGSPLSDTYRTNLIQSFTGVVCFASPSSAISFLKEFNPRENRLYEALTAMAIGSTTAAEVRQHFRTVITPQAATAAALAAAALKLVHKNEIET